MCMVGICWFNKWQHILGHTIFFHWSNTINLHSCSKSGCFCKHWITIREEIYRSHIYGFPRLQLDFFPSCPSNKNKMKWLGNWLSVLLQVHLITAFYMRTWNAGSYLKNMKTVILTFMPLHCNCTQPKAGRSNAVLSEQLRSPASHSCPPSPAPPTHAILKWLHVSCVLKKKKKKIETIPSFYFLSSYIYFPHDRTARCKYKAE